MVFGLADGHEKLGHHLGNQFHWTEVAPFVAPVGNTCPHVSLLVGALDNERGLC